MRRELKTCLDQVIIQSSRREKSLHKLDRREDLLLAASSKKIETYSCQDPANITNRMVIL
jgi:hypothetical protein